MKPLRIIHFGTGYVGADALRQIIDSPQFELVGMLVHTPAKEGKDAGEICGRPPTGIIATRDIEALCAIEADCVAYFATEWGRPIEETIEQMARFLASGKNLVTTTYPPLVHPAGVPPVQRQLLVDACEKGGSSMLCTGLQPGFTSDVLPLGVTSMTRAVRSIRIHERTNIYAYPDPLSFEGIGFGRTPEEDALAHQPGFISTYFRGTMATYAQCFGISFDEIREVRRFALADRDYVTDAGPIPKGTIASVMIEVQGIINGKSRVSHSVVYNMVDDCIDDFAPVRPYDEKRTTLIEIEGEPDITLELSLADPFIQPGCIATAARAVNAIPQVCAAPPGFHSPLSLPEIHGLRFIGLED